jgi:PAS domain S-box-containing protein
MSLKRLLRIGRALRRRPARTLPGEESRFLLALDTFREGCQIIDRQWRYVYLNAAAARQGGKTPGELIGQAMPEIYPGIEATNLFAVLKHCMDERVHGTLENEFILPNGSSSWFDLAIEPVPEGLFILSVDITDRKRAEEALQETQSRFNAFMDASPTLKWIKDDAGRYLWMNRAWSEAFSLEREASVGTTVSDFVVPERAAMITEIEAAVLRTERPVETIEDTEYPAGNLRSWHFIRFLFRSPSGQRFIGGIGLDVTKLKAAETAVHEAQSQLEVVVDHLEEGLTICDPTGRLLHWNSAAARMHGFAEKGDWRGGVSQFAEVLELIAPDGSVVPIGEWPLMRILRGEPVKDLELVVRHLDGSFERVLSYSGSVAHYSEEKSLVYMTLTDKTNQKRAEKQLQATNERVHQLLEHSSAVMIALTIMDGIATATFVTDNVTRLLGFTPEEATTPNWWDRHIHPDDRERAVANLLEGIANGSNRLECRFRHKDGNYRWIDDSLTVARRQSDGGTEVVAVLTDVTERHSAQDELRESERRFRNMLDNLGLIAMMLDRDGNIIYCNDHLLRLTGWTREELLGCNWIETFIPEELRHDLISTFNTLLDDMPAAWHHENEIITRTGKRLLIQWNNSVLRSAAGEVIGTTSIGEDVTERKALERQIVRTQRLESLGTLASGVAHDLNNILMPILMGATLLKRLDPTPSAQKAIHNIEVSVKRGSDLVKQVLLFARGADTPREAVDLRSVLGDVEAMVTSTFPKNIVLEQAIAPDLATVTGDATQIVQVLLNLCVNARDAMPHGGRIVVSASNLLVTEHEARACGGRSGGAHVLVEVTDTGSGIPAEIVDRIFDPFFTTKEIGKGTGLGLSTAQGIVASHDGFITVKSRIGEGTSFQVYLPVRETDDVEGHASPGLTVVPRGNGELILLVDDDASILNITQQTLETFGYRVLTAEDGARAIGIYSQRQSEIALVVTDVGMPILDGVALVAALMRMNPAVRIIAASGTAASIAKIAQFGVTTVLEKPFTADRLLRTVAEVIAQPTGHS